MPHSSLDPTTAHLLPSIISPRRLHLLLLMLVVLVAGGVRMAGLGNIPPGLFRDEAEKGYNAWSLATTGGMLEFSGGVGPGPAIQWRRFPWMVNVMGGKTSAIYQYVSAPLVALGGLSVTTTRLASALTGTLTVFIVGLTLMRAWGAWTGLAAAIWLALMPWHIVFSRWALEGIFVPLFVVLTLSGLWGVERRREWGWPVAGAALGWLFYAYSGAQPFVLAWGACLLAIYRHRLPWRNRFFWLGLILFLIPVVPTVMVRLEPGGSTRLGRIAVWSEPGLSALQIAGRIALNYLRHFDPRFLFICGDTLPRHGIPGMGQLTPIAAVLLPLGIYVGFRRRLPLRWALLAVLLCGPLPAAITRGSGPHALRAFAMTVPIAVWCGLGLAAATFWILRKAVARGVPDRRARLYAAAFVASCVLVPLNGFVRYWRACQHDPAMQVAFENGERLAWQRLSKELKASQRVFVNGNIPYVPYYQLFFMQPDPLAVAKSGLEQGQYFYFAPETLPHEVVQQKMRPGDWMIFPVNPASLTLPDGTPWITPEAAARVGEVWIEAFQKPVGKQ